MSLSEQELIAMLPELTAPLSRSRGLPNAAYVEPELFEFECRSLLGRTWTAIAYERELPDPGAVKPVEGSRHYDLATSAGIEMPRISGWPEEKLRHAEYIALYPNTLLGLQADHFFSVIVLPQAADRSLEKVQIAYVGDAAGDERYAACRQTVLESWEAVFREDVFAVEGMQAGRRSPGFNGGVLTPVQDVPTHHFHRWVAKAYADAIGLA